MQGKAYRMEQKESSPLTPRLLTDPRRSWTTDAGPAEAEGQGDAVIV